MSKHIKNPRPHNRNYDSMSLRYIADELDVSKQEARMIVSKMHSAVWLDSPVLSSSASVVPEAEDGIHKYGYYIE